MGIQSQPNTSREKLDAYNPNSQRPINKASAFESWNSVELRRLLLDSMVLVFFSKRGVPSTELGSVDSLHNIVVVL